jgi:hypothetical protein
MALQYTPGGDPSAVYYGTDTHASALLIGSALALAYPLASLASLPAVQTKRLDAAGVAGLAVLAWAIGHFSGNDPAVYPVGLILAALAAACLVAAAAGNGVIAVITSLPPLRWVGVRSYGMYLWHWPVIALAAALAGSGPTSAWAWVIETAITIALAAASWRFIETPILQNGLRATIRHWRQRLADVRYGPGHGGRRRGDHRRGGCLRRGPATTVGHPGRPAPAGRRRPADQHRLTVGEQLSGRHVGGLPRREAAGGLGRPGDRGRRLDHGRLGGRAGRRHARHLHQRAGR